MHYQRVRQHGDPGPVGRLRDEPKPLCSVEGCERVVTKRGWCDMHYGRVRLTGDPGPAHRIKGGEPRFCSVEGCQRKHSAKGLCKLHYDRALLTGDPGPVGYIADEPREPRLCDVADCGRFHYARGLCRMHYRRAWEPNKYRIKAFGDPGPVEQLREPEPQPAFCEVEDCTNKARTHRLCDKHWRRFQVYGTTSLIEVEETCRYCGAIFRFTRDSDNAGSLYCSKECKLFAKTQRSRLRQAKVRAPFIDWRQIAERDEWRCGICDKRVTPQADPRSPKAPSVDHVVALANGGEHSWDNVQLAHLGCNAGKRDQWDPTRPGAVKPRTQSS